MIYRSARIERALVARVEAGEELAWALAELARWEKLDAALVRGSGTLLWAELAAGGAPARLEGPLAVTVTGTVAFRDGALEIALHALLLGAEGARAGTLVAAAAEQVELVVDVLDDPGREWRIHPATGRTR